MEKRKTIQKKLVHDAVLEMKRHVTADEVYEYIKEEHPSIGKATIYRNLSILADEGLIRRVEIPNGPDCFDFTLKRHFHMRCIKCRKVHDVFVGEIENFEKTIASSNGTILDYDILFKGICEECKIEEKEA